MYELEQHILGFSTITSDLAAMVKHKASPAELEALATVYEFKFEQLWAAFENVIKENRAPVYSTITSSAKISKTKFFDDDSTEFDLSYGKYDEDDKSSWILGIDSNSESISMCVKDLSTLAAKLSELSTRVGPR